MSESLSTEKDAPPILDPVAIGALLLHLNSETDEQPWREYAACANTDMLSFFPDSGGVIKVTRRICRGCDVRDRCLEYALANTVKGFWGGLSERERRRLKRKMPE